MAVGFELIKNKTAFTELIRVTLATGIAINMGDACVFSASQSGSVEAAVDGSTRIAGVAVFALASSASEIQVLDLYDPRGQYKVNRKSGETAGPTAVNLEVDFDSASAIDQSDAGANKPVLILETITTAAAGESRVTFTDTIFGNRA